MEELSQNASLEEVIIALNKIIAHINGTDVKHDNELVLSRTNELVIASGKKVAREVYDKVLSHINTEVAPKVNALLEHISMATEDGQLTVDEYRRESHAADQARVAGLLTASESQMASSRIVISPYVSYALAPVVKSDR